MGISLASFQLWGAVGVCHVLIPVASFLIDPTGERAAATTVIRRSLTSLLLHQTGDLVAMGCLLSWTWVHRLVCCVEWCY